MVQVSKHAHTNIRRLLRAVRQHQQQPELITDDLRDKLNTYLQDAFNVLQTELKNNFLEEDDKCDFAVADQVVNVDKSALRELELEIDELKSKLIDLAYEKEQKLLLTKENDASAIQLASRPTTEIQQGVYNAAASLKSPSLKYQTLPKGWKPTQILESPKRVSVASLSTLPAGGALSSPLQRQTAATLRNRRPVSTSFHSRRLNNHVDMLDALLEGAAAAATEEDATATLGKKQDDNEMLQDQEKQQEQLYEELRKITTELKGKAIAVRQSLEEEKQVLEKGAQMMGTNVSKTQTENKKMDDHYAKMGGNLFTKILMLLVVFALFFFMLLVIKLLPARR